MKLSTTQSIEHPAIPAAEEAQPLSMLALCRIIWSRKFFIGGMVLAFMALGYIATSFGTRTYTAETLLVIEDTTAGLATGAMSRNAAPYANPAAAIEVFGSRRLIEQVVDNLNLTARPELNPFLVPKLAADEPEVRSFVDFALAWLQGLLPRGEHEEEAPPSEALVRQATIDVVQERVRFLTSLDSSIIRVLVMTEDPAFSADLANAVADAFLNDLLEARLDAVDRVAEQFGQRINELRQDLRDREGALQDFQNANEDFDPQLLASLGDQALRLRQRLSQVDRSLTEGRIILSQLSTISALPETDQRDAVLADPVLSVRGDGVTGRTGPELVAALRREAEQSVQRGEQLTGSLRSSLSELESQYATMSEQAVRFQQLQREIEASSEIYEISIRRLNELLMQSGIENGVGRIIFQAEPPQLPTGRGRVRIILILSLLGLFTALSWVLIREATNQTVRMPSDLRTVARSMRIVPVPRAPRGGFSSRRTQAARLLISPDVTLYSEAVRRLRSSLFRDEVRELPAVVQVTSDYTTTSKTILAIALSRSCALIGKRVLLIGADLRNSGIMSQQLKLPIPDHGLQEILVGREMLQGAVQSHPELGVHVLLPSRMDANPVDLLQLETFGAMLKAAAVDYDVIVIDTPPALVAPDAGLISLHATHKLFVVAARASTLASVTSAVGDLFGGLNSHQDVIALYGGKANRQVKRPGASQKFARI